MVLSCQGRVFWAQELLSERNQNLGGGLFSLIFLADTWFFYPIKKGDVICSLHCLSFILLCCQLTFAFSSMPCLFAVPCAYLLYLATFSYLDASYVPLQPSFFVPLVVTSLTCLRNTVTHKCCHAIYVLLCHHSGVKYLNTLVCYISSV